MSTKSKSMCLVYKKKKSNFRASKIRRVKFYPSRPESAEIESQSRDCVWTLDTGTVVTLTQI